MLNDDLTPIRFDDINMPDNKEYYEALTPSNINGMLSPLNINNNTEIFSMSYNS